MIYFDPQLSEWSPAALVSPGHVLPMGGDDEEFILASVKLEEILADGPVAPKAAKGAVSHLPVIMSTPTKKRRIRDLSCRHGCSFALITSAGALDKKNSTCRLKYVIYSTDLVIYIGRKSGMYIT